MGLRQRAAEHGEILGEDIDEPAIDRTLAGDHAVAGNLLFLHAEIGTLVLDEHVIFLERAFIEQGLDTLARGEFAFLVLAFNALLAAAETRTLAACFQLLDNVLHPMCPASSGGVPCNHMTDRCAAGGWQATFRAQP